MIKFNFVFIEPHSATDIVPDHNSNIDKFPVPNVLAAVQKAQPNAAMLAFMLYGEEIGVMYNHIRLKFIEGQNQILCVFVFKEWEVNPGEDWPGTYVAAYINTQTVSDARQYEFAMEHAQQFGIDPPKVKWNEYKFTNGTWRNSGMMESMEEMLLPRYATIIHGRKIALTMQARTPNNFTVN